MTEAIGGRERLDAFNDKLRQLGIEAYWMRPPRDTRVVDPQVLKWKTIYPLLLEAGEVVQLGADAFRRNMAGYQIVMPERLRQPIAIRPLPCGLWWSETDRPTPPRMANRCSWSRATS